MELQAAEIRCQVYQEGTSELVGQLQMMPIWNKVKSYTLIRTSAALGHDDVTEFSLVYTSPEGLYVGVPVPRKKFETSEALLELKFNRDMSRGVLRVGHQLLPQAIMGKYRAFRVANCLRN